MLYYFATEGMIQTNNADLGKAFRGGMKTWRQDRPLFCVCMMWSSEVCVCAQPFPAIRRLIEGQARLATDGPNCSFVLEFSIC